MITIIIASILIAVMILPIGIVISQTNETTNIGREASYYTSKTNDIFTACDSNPAVTNECMKIVKEFIEWHKIWFNDNMDTIEKILYGQ